MTIYKTTTWECATSCRNCFVPSHAVLTSSISAVRTGGCRQ